MATSFKIPSLMVCAAAGVFLLGHGIASAAVDSTEVSAVQAGTYETDGSHTSVEARINHMGFSTTTVRFPKTMGEFTFDPAHPEAAKLNVTVDVNALTSDWEARDKELKGPAFFNAAKFPTATFASTSLTKVDATHAQVYGQLTLLGVTKPVKLEVTFLGAGKGMAGDTRVGFQAHAKIQRSDFGMKTFLPAIGDTVDLTIDTEFVKKK